jgi:hypothetical protein
MLKFGLYRWLATDAIGILWLPLHAYLQTKTNFQYADIPKIRKVFGTIFTARFLL